MPASTQQHPCLLVLSGHAAARAELRAAAAEHRPAKLASQFLGALGEGHAAKILGASHVSHKVDECDRPRGNGSQRVTNKHRTYYVEPKDRYRVIW